MSDKELRELNACREKEELRALNAFIAEHVMGWKISDMMGLRNGRFAMRLDGIYTPVWGDRKYYIQEFAPSTDPAAAMQVLEKCVDETPRKRKWHNCVSISH